MTECRICKTLIEPFMTLGRMPIANAFKHADEIGDEFYFDLMPAICPICATFQITEIPSPEQMFHDKYAYFASTSAYMAEHWRKMAKAIIAERLFSDDPLVIEIGSNDGITLQNFANRGIRHVGIEPSSNVAEVARAKGITTLSAFFGEAIAERIVDEYGQADVFIATNTMHHIQDTNSVATGVAKLLKPKGLFISEDPYLGDMVELTAYDQIYAEHMYIWSLSALRNVFDRVGMEIVDIIRTPVHGGCMRYFIGHKGEHEISDAVKQAFAQEQNMGLDQPATFEAFRRDCEKARESLMNVLVDLNACGKRVVGYGAPAKSTVIVNYCGISTKHIEYISDSTPIKQGKVSPGQHIPIETPEAFCADYPDYALLFAWNHQAEIFAKETAYRDAGGKWILPVPHTHIV